MFTVEKDESAVISPNSLSFKGFPEVKREIFSSFFHKSNKRMTISENEKTQLPQIYHKTHFFVFLASLLHYPFDKVPQICLLSFGKLV